MKLFELWAELGLDSSNFNRGVAQASKQGNAMSESLSKGFSVVTSKTIALGNAMYDTGKGIAKMAMNLAEDVIKEFSDTEQLLGGVSTIFQDSAQTVIANAENAYKTAGMSANEYMQTVTSFSSSLIQSLKGNTAEAARLSDMAIQDMSDNANKFGTDMGSIQNAYMGFAKQNYTMLDNLKLGYGGTRQEMQRLLKDAQKIQRENGNNVRYNIKNLDDIIEAIHVIQEEMNITGTTAAEANDTISGSFKTFQASWKNLLSGFANDDADINKLTNNLLDSGKNLFENIANLLPAIGSNAKQFYDILVEETEKTFPVIKSMFRDAWDKHLPQIVTKGVNGIVSIINSTLGTNIPAIKEIDLPTWDQIESSVTAWWASTKANIEKVASWTLGIFTNPAESADEIKATILVWWNDTARPTIEEACKWVLQSPYAPNADQTEIEKTIIPWWETAGEWVSNACSWVLQMGHVPTESAETIAGNVQTWWNGISKTLNDICFITFSVFADDPEKTKEYISATWEDIKKAVVDFVTMPVTFTFPLADKFIPIFQEAWADIKEKTNGYTKLPITFTIPLADQVADKINTWWKSVTDSLNLTIPIAGVSSQGSGVHESESGAQHGGGTLGRWDIPSHATGLDYVPYDNYLAYLHAGEAVLTRNEAREWRNDQNNSIDMSAVINLLSGILSAVQNPVPAIIDEEGVYSYINSRAMREAQWNR